MATEPTYTEFSDSRLVALYDSLNPFGPDSEFFCTQAKRLSAKNIIDLGCGTGLLTCELANRGHEMTGIDPSKAMLAIARQKPSADRIEWREGSFEQMEGLQADMILMTSHVAQFFLGDDEWRGMLRAAHRALSLGGHLVFDIRRLSEPPFARWPTDENRRRVQNTSAGEVEWWFKLIDVRDGRVRYELHYLFVGSGEEVVSVNELVFRSQGEITEALSDLGFSVKVVYGNWDLSSVSAGSPEMIFIAVRS